MIINGEAQIITGIRIARIAIPTAGSTINRIIARQSINTKAIMGPTTPTRITKVNDIASIMAIIPQINLRKGFWGSQLPKRISHLFGFQPLICNFFHLIFTLHIFLFQSDNNPVTAIINRNQVTGTICHFNGFYQLFQVNPFLS